jgi:hypothetical protein
MRRALPLLAVLLSAGLVACDKIDPAEDGGIPSSNFVSLFEPTAGTVPFPFDGLFSGFADPTLNIANPQNAPFVTDANRLDGFSTTATAFTDMIGFVDLDSARSGILVIDTSTGQRLVEGVDYRLTDYPATAPIPGTNPPVLAPVNAVRSRVMIHPLKPLKPSTRYLVAVTNAVRDTAGNRLVASTQFRITRRATPVAEQTDPSLAVLNPTQRATLETLRAQLVRPAVEGVIAASQGQLTEDDIVLAWTFTTQSTGKTLARLSAEASARPIIAAPTGLNTQQINPALPPVANVFVGRIDLPYYLPDAGGNPQSQAPLTGFWEADPTRPDLAATFLGQVPCAAFAAGAPLPGGITAAASPPPPASRCRASAASSRCHCWWPCPTPTAAARGPPPAGRW